MSSAGGEALSTVEESKDFFTGESVGGKRFDAMTPAAFKISKSPELEHTARAGGTDHKQPAAMRSQPDLFPANLNDSIREQHNQGGSVGITSKAARTKGHEVR